MAISNVIFDILNTYNPLTAIVGNKIFPMRIIAGTEFPAISYHQISVTPSNTKDQYSSLDFVRLQISVFAKDSGGVSGFDQANDIAQKVRDAIENKAALLPQDILNYKVNQLFYDGEQQLADDTADFAGVYQVAIDVILGYNR